MTAAIVALALTAASHLWSCTFSSRDTCLMSQGLFWVGFVILFFFVGLPTAVIAKVVRDARSKDRAKDDPG